MAFVSIPTIVDYLDASTDGVDTYTFALQGVAYEIDLSAPHADTLFALLNPYIQAGRRLPKNATTSRKNSKAGKATGSGGTGRAAKHAARTGKPADKPGTGAQPTRRTRTRPRVAEPTAPELRNWWAEKAEELDLPTFRSRGAIPGRVREAYANRSQP